MTQLDILTGDELLIAKAPATKTEQNSAGFGKTFPREFGFPVNYLHYYYRQRALAKLLQSIPGLPERLEEFRSNFGSNFGRGLRLAHIDHLYRKLKPEFIFEFGAGVSTFIFAELLRDNYQKGGNGGKIVSFEQSPDYFERLNKSFPKDLLEFIELKLCPVQLKWWKDERGIFYKTPVPNKADLIYIDGPTRPRGSDEINFYFSRFNADIVHWYEKGCQIKYAFTDHRWSNYLSYVRHLESDFDISCSRWWKSILISPK